MAIQGDTVGRYLSGSDILIKDCNIFINQPTIKTILQYGENNFFAAVNVFAQTDKMLQTILEEDPSAKILSEFNLFLLIYQEEANVQNQINDFFNLVFPQYEIRITNNSIDFIQEQDKKQTIRGQVNPFTYPALKQTIVELFLPYTISQEEYNTKSKRANEIAEKLKKGRQKVAAQKNEDDTSLFGTYISILSIGMNIDMRILFNYTPFQLYDSFMRYNNKVAQDRYFAITTIPFADTSNIEAPDEWTANLYK